ncbi:CLUMA_CG014135, isoform A [Clunio marinus]|uniref:CLUMA_CG014135, isoform A n=1 Tax=Clunio marinus TaxID=568069 RepID=A0A1J1IMW2_9DIPT|nr:CLUMA_CG014135, isoform A [Clunio marinus]
MSTQMQTSAHGQLRNARKSIKGSIQSTTYEFPYMRQPEKKTLGQLIYDREKGKILGRTLPNWGELLIFYTVFYISLAALFAICFKALMMTIPFHKPKWILDKSLIGTNPGLGFRPMSKDVVHGSLIWYDITEQKQVNYTHEKIRNNHKNCGFGSLPDSHQVCNLNIEDFDECSKSRSYGYNNSSPCIFLKLNRIYGWIPEYYNDINDLPSDMPEDLVEYIKSRPQIERDQVWVSCSGENSVDREVVGDIAYFPTQLRGFPSYFFPYTNIKGYLSPLVAVKFKRPKPNQIINIQCRAWAKNINYNGSHRDRQGSVHFELMIDAPIN